MPGRKCRVLLVEDDTDTSAAFAHMLELLGHQVTAVTTAEGALALIRTNEYDAIVLDLVLPDDSGLVVLREVRQRELSTRVAVVTALYQGDLPPTMGELEADVVFKKPVDAMALAGWVTEAASRGSGCR